MELKFKKNWFLLGNFPSISAAELSAVLKLHENDYLIKENFLICDKDIGDSDELIKRLGGTIKIAVFSGTADTIDQLSDKITNIIAGVNGKIVFGISAYFEDEDDTAQWVYNLGKTIKKELKKNQLSCRYVFNREAVLSSVTVQKNNLLEKGFEFLIFKENNKYYFAQTKAVQPFEEWGRRDIGRPKRDQKSGMLPSKLARMMINIADVPLSSVLLDPFCGSGTILNEATALGYKKIIGTDISEKAVEDAKNNINWLNQKNSVDIFQSDVQLLNKKIKTASVDAVISEPYLGRPLNGNEEEKILLGQAEELKKIYLKAFTTFKIIVKPGGIIIFIIPRFRHKNEWITIDCQNNIEKLGFIAEPFYDKNKEKKSFLLYSRFDQRVGREIWKFKKIAS